MKNIVSPFMSTADDRPSPQPYFYPIKSLFTGGIRPESPPLNVPSRESESRHDDTGIIHLPPLNQNAASDIGSSSSNLSGTIVSQLDNVPFQHVRDEHGNHIVIGPQGEIHRCEDEPIRTPGTIQGFGVLIAIEDTGDALVVRQVSENSTELLGLSPSYLFSLSCFTDTLLESQADVLWDNIEFLGKSKSDLTDEGDECPHVFLLSGLGGPGSGPAGSGRMLWTCWCAVHRLAAGPSSGSINSPGLLILEFEWEKDIRNPLYPPLPSLTGSLFNVNSQLPTRFGTWDATESNIPSPALSAPPVVASTLDVLGGLDGQDDWVPNQEDILESTTSYSKPLPGLERLRKANEPTSASAAIPPGPSRRRSHRKKSRDPDLKVGMMDIFAIMAQINEQLDAVSSLELFLKVVVGIMRDLTQFHRVLVYRFDEAWNGQVVAEIVDWNQTRDLYKGLHFPASDIPAQARALYAINKVRILYDRGQETARIVTRAREDLEVPLDMTHCYLRAMSPVHIKYLANMGVRASMSVSITAFGSLWGLIACHSYGSHGMRVPFPIRQMLRLLSQSISKHVERLSYAERLHTKKLINSMVSSQHPTGYIVSTDDLLGLFDADCGILVVGEGAKIIGPNQHSQEMLAMAEYLRLKKYSVIQASEAITHDFPDLHLPHSLNNLAGVLIVPLSSQGADFIAFFRKGQPKQVRWAGKPYKEGREQGASLEPRKSFKIWSEIVAGRCRSWTDEQLDTAGVLALVYGKFIEVWRQKESALRNSKLRNLLLSNASHEVRTPLNHIINYLEMALNGPLDAEARDHLTKSHAASKGLLFTINDLLDLTLLETGNETSFHEPFDLCQIIEDATTLYKKEANRRNIEFILELDECPKAVIGDSKKISTVVQNLTANSVKYTSKGSITIRCSTSTRLEDAQDSSKTSAEIVVADSGCGIPPQKLDLIFREFEQVDSIEPTKNTDNSGMGLGLAVVARIVHQLGGQLRIHSTVGEGTRVAFFIPLGLPERGNTRSRSSSLSVSQGSRSRAASFSQDEIDSLVEALVQSPMGSSPRGSPGHLESPISVRHPVPCVLEVARELSTSRPCTPKLRILVAEDNDINRTILSKRLTLDGHDVVSVTNGQECVDLVESDRAFHAILMDIQMPILNGFEASQRIRKVESPIAAEEEKACHIHHRIPIFAISASLLERQHKQLYEYGMDGWILKPIDFRRLKHILQGVTDPFIRNGDTYHPGYNWELGGWLLG